MLRRVHTPHLAIGRFDLPDAQAHHIRDVLRLQKGDSIELFDDAGATATARLINCDPAQVSVTVDQIDPPPAIHLENQLTIASAIPKGSRADWMIEKLSEIGVHRFIPVAAERSVVLPDGKAKLTRWQRLATEAARQSGRSGVMRIDPLANVTDIVAEIRASAEASGVFLSPHPPAQPIFQSQPQPPPRSLVLLIGPEGGWTQKETDLFAEARLAALRLTDTILRIETAALVAAGVLMCQRVFSERPRSA